jgi:primase-polymerase (primpol)-like protein
VPQKERRTQRYKTHNLPQPHGLLVRAGMERSSISAIESLAAIPTVSSNRCDVKNQEGSDYMINELLKSVYESLDLTRLDNLPPNLLSGKRFVCWREESRDGKPTKIPVNPHNGNDSRSNDMATWGTIDKATAFYKANSDTLNGVGRMFHSGDGLVGIDFDDCLDENRNIISGSPAAEWVIRFNSYSEISPSGRGLKVWVKANHDFECKTGRRDAERGIEIYGSGRYFTITGRRLEIVSNNVESRQNEFEDFYRVFFVTNKPAEQPTAQKATGFTDDEVLKRANKAKNSEKFKQLWCGNWQVAGYGSQSEADAALCAMLWFWKGDREDVRILFGKSELGKRDKWTARPDYQESTLDCVCGGEVYESISNLLEIGAGATHKTLPSQSTDIVDKEELETKQFSTAVVSSAELRTLVIEPRDMILSPFLKAGDLGFIYGPRGEGRHG